MEKITQPGSVLSAPVTGPAVGLGTVQFGLPYGNRSRGELLSETECFEIVAAALRYGIRFFDTAASYGVSEERLGGFLRGSSAAVATKIPSVDSEIWKRPSLYRNFVLTSIEQSRKRLAVHKINLLQFHQCDEAFLESKALRDVAREIMEKGLCDRLGVSVYSPSEMFLALEVPEFKSFQVPLNFIDRRFASEKVVSIVKSKELQIIARSVFLQGIFVESAPLPQVAKRIQLGTLRNMLQDTRRELGSGSLEEMALAFVFLECASWVSVGIFGVESVADLEKNMKLISSMIPLPAGWENAFERARDYATELDLINPRTWDQK